MYVPANSMGQTIRLTHNQVGVIPASFISMFYTGFIGDRMNIWLAKRNGGVHKPEHLLWQLVFPTVTVIVGLVAIALPADRPQDYSYWGMVIGLSHPFKNTDRA